MNIAVPDIWVFVVIAIFALLGKAWNSLSSQIDDETAESEPKPATPPPQQRTRPRPQRPTAPTRETPGGWRAGQEELKKFFEQMQRPAAPPRLPRKQTATPPVPVPMAEPIASVATHPTPAAPPAPAMAAKPSVPSRATQWAAALRDRENLRHIVLSAEIIGPPKAL